MNGCDINEDLYLNCDIHGPWDRVQTLGFSQYGYMYMYKIISTPISIFEKKLSA